MATGVLTSLPGTPSLDQALSTLRRQERLLEAKLSDKLRVNSDLTRALVSFQANRSESEHRWYKYKEGFSASLVRYVLSKVGPQGGCLLDPFAGSGTALFCAHERGLRSVGIELLPIGIEIIEVRKLLLAADRENLAREITAFSERSPWRCTGPEKSFLHLRITAGAFPPETERDLARYLHEAERVEDKLLARVLRFAALCVLEAVSFTRKDGQYLRWDSRSGRRAGAKPFHKGPIPSFTRAISEKLRQIAHDLSADHLLFRNPTLALPSAPIEILRGSCLDILPTLAADSFDGIITSPPYCNRYDYTRTYALELAMLGVGEEQIGQLRQAMLTSTVENREKESLGAKFPNDPLNRAREAVASQRVLCETLSFLERCKREGKLNNNGIPRMIRNYFLELAFAIFECARVLKPGAPFVMVNDNVRYQGAHVPVDLILSEIAEKAGLKVEAIWILPKGKGNSSQQMGLHGREELRKCVYVWSKPLGPSAR